MKAVVTKASDCGEYEEIKCFENLEDLLEFVKKCGYGIILEENYRTSSKAVEECEYAITIYDDYVE